MPARPRLVPAAAVVSAVLLAVLAAATPASYFRTFGYARAIGPTRWAAAACDGRGYVVVGRDPYGYGRLGAGFASPAPVNLLLPLYLPPRFHTAGFSYGEAMQFEGPFRWATFPLWAPMLPLAVPPALWWHPPPPAAPPGLPGRHFLQLGRQRFA